MIESEEVQRAIRACVRKGESEEVLFLRTVSNLIDSDSVRNRHGEDTIGDFENNTCWLTESSEFRPYDMCFVRNGVPIKIDSESTNIPQVGSGGVHWPSNTPLSSIKHMNVSQLGRKYHKNTGPQGPLAHFHIKHNYYINNFVVTDWHMFFKFRKWLIKMIEQGRCYEKTVPYKGAYSIKIFDSETNFLYFWYCEDPDNAVTAVTGEERSISKQFARISPAYAYAKKIAFELNYADDFPPAFDYMAERVKQIESEKNELFTTI